MWYLYILKCSDNKYYTGVTGNLERRFQEHKEGIGGYYTKNNKPIKIIYSECFETKQLALDREEQLKRWTKFKKTALIEGRLKDLRELSRSRD